MKRYVMKSCPEAVELPQESLEFAVREIAQLKDFIESDATDVIDGKASHAIDQEKFYAAKRLLGRYVSLKAKSAVETDLIDPSALKHNYHDPFIFLAQ